MDGFAWLFIGFMAFMLFVAIYRVYRSPHDFTEIGKQPCEHRRTPFWCKSCNRLILWTEYRNSKEIVDAYVNKARYDEWVGNFFRSFFNKPKPKPPSDEDEEIWRIVK